MFYDDKLRLVSRTVVILQFKSSDIICSRIAICLFEHILLNYNGNATELEFRRAFYSLQTALLQTQPLCAIRLI